MVTRKLKCRHDFITISFRTASSSRTTPLVLCATVCEVSNGSLWTEDGGGSSNGISGNGSEKNQAQVSFNLGLGSVTSFIFQNGLELWRSASGETSGVKTNLSLKMAYKSIEPN